jgi:transitional endoplasmic reticulum ATPase
MATATTDKPQTARPAFVNRVLDDYRKQVAHQFLLVGAGADYVAPGISAPEYFGLIFEPSRPLIVYYSLHEGITFLDERPREATVPVNQAKQPASWGPRRITMRGAFETIGEKSGWLEPMGQPNAAAAALGGSASQPKKRNLPSGPREAVAMLLRLMATADQATTVVIIEGMDLVCPPGDKGAMPEARATVLGMLRSAGRDRVMEQSQNMLLMFAPSAPEVHEDIRSMSSGTRLIDIPLPGYQARLDFITAKLESEGWRLSMTPDAFAALTSGLMLRHIEDIALRAGAADNDITPDFVANLKKEIIQAEGGGVLNVLEPRAGLDRIGGAQHFKEWAAKLLLAPAADPSIRNEMPLSFLLSGPPGTGKTTIAECLAFDMAWNCVEYQSIKGSLVGESEKNDAKAERIIRAMAPVIVFMDEIDQMGGRVTGGAGGGGDAVEASLFRSRLKFMGDTTLRGEVLFIGASNRPDQIDDALTSRFEYRIPILPPEDDEARADVLARLCLRHDIYVEAGADAGGATMARPVEWQDMLTAAKLMRDWAGRDMDGAINKARTLMRLDKLGAKEAVEAAARTRRPMIRSDAEMMTRLAIADCNDTDLLPLRYREVQATIDRAELETDIATVRSRNAAIKRTLDV